MPEGPEVALLATHLSEIMSGSLITSFKILGGRYYGDKKPKGYDIFIDMMPLKIKKVNSKGKFLWFVLSSKKNNKLYLMNTLGLTGSWSFQKSKSSRIHFEIENCKYPIYDLYFTDQRNFGTLEFTEDIEELKKRKYKLAPDILRSSLNDQEMVDIIKKWIAIANKKNINQNIVNVLMGNQGAIFSGIGNYLIAEILYCSHISPHRDLNSLKEKELLDLVHNIRFISKLSFHDNKSPHVSDIIDYAKKNNFRITYPVFHPDINTKNMKFTFKVYGRKEDECGNHVENDEIIKGRTAYWVPQVQK
jgi:formamidopyrimidine-DNA glycosylase